MELTEKLLLKGQLLLFCKSFQILLGRAPIFFRTVY